MDRNEKCPIYPLLPYVDEEVDVDINEEVSALVNVDVDVYEN